MFRGLDHYKNGGANIIGYVIGRQNLKERSESSIFISTGNRKRDTGSGLSF